MKAYVVCIYEYERGWGSRLDGSRLFATKPEALAYVDEFNSKNTDTVVPDWYMVAEYVGLREVQ